MEPGDGKVDGRRIEDALREIQQMLVIGIAEAATDVGDYLLGVFFEGNPERFHGQEYRNPDFEALCAREEDLSSMGVGRSTLLNCVRVAIQARRHGRKVLSRLPFSHQVMLLSAPQGSVRKLARRAVDESYSAAELKQEIRKLKPRSVKPGRPRRPAVVSVVTKSARLLEDLDDAWLDELADARGFDLDTTLAMAREALGRLQYIVDRLDDLQALQSYSSSPPVDLRASTSME